MVMSGQVQETKPKIIYNTNQNQRIQEKIEVENDVNEQQQQDRNEISMTLEQLLN